jgi:hypothetical protein
MGATARERMMISAAEVLRNMGLDRVLWSLKRVL